MKPRTHYHIYSTNNFVQILCRFCVKQGQKCLFFDKKSELYEYGLPLTKQIKTADFCGINWRAQKDSNPQPSDP